MLYSARTAADLAFADELRAAGHVVHAPDLYDGKTFTDYKGQRIAFCCGMCVPKFEADPAKYMAKIKEAASKSKTPAKAAK